MSIGGRDALSAAKRGRIKRTGTLCTVIATALISLSQNLAIAQSAFDGNYAGVMAIASDRAANRVGVFGNRGAVRGENYGRLKPCSPGPFHRLLPIRNGQFSFLYNRELQTTLSGSVAGDGSLAASIPTAQGGVKLAAQITGNDLVGTVGGAYCVYSLQLRKQS
jgi:hypothetical protein